MKTNSLGKDAIILSTSKIITIIITLVSAMLLSRFRTLEEYGTYSQILMVVTLISSLLMLGLPNSINYFLIRAETEEERSKFLSVYYTLSTILSGFVGLVLILATPLIVVYFNNPLLNSFIYFLAVFPWTKIIMVSIENVLIVSQRTKFLMGYRILNSISLLCIILFVQICNLKFSHYMLIYLMVEIIFTIWVYIIVKNITVKFQFLLNKKIIKTILTFSIPIGLASMVGVINLELDKLIISGYLGTESLALYTNAGKELPITVISASIIAVLMPRLVQLLKKNENKRAIDLWGDATVLSYIIICFFVTSLIVFAPQVMTILYSEKYIAAVDVFRVYNLVLLLRVTYFGIILNSLGRTKFIMYSSLISLGLNMILNFICLHIMGFIGPAVATFLSIALVAIYQLIYTSRIIKFSFKRIMPWTSIMKITLLNLFMGGVVFITTSMLKLQISVSDIVICFVIGVIWALIYFLFMWKKILLYYKNINGV